MIVVASVENLSCRAAILQAKVRSPSRICETTMKDSSTWTPIWYASDSHEWTTDGDMDTIVSNNLPQAGSVQLNVEHATAQNVQRTSSSTSTDSWEQLNVATLAE